MNNGIFILSLDCEGKWGFADRVDSLSFADQLSTSRLASIYRTLVQVLARYRVPATFAFVGLFASPSDEAEKFLPQLRDSDSHRDWLGPFFQQWDAGRTDGWFCPEALRYVQESGDHEIASHGFTHLPFKFKQVDEKARDFELGQSKAWGRSHGFDIETIIFPRNEIEALALLQKHQIIGYRKRVENEGSRFGRVINEFRTSFPSEKKPSAADPVAIPAGYFLNWRFSARRYVPLSITAKRWQSILEHAAANDGVAHLWFHPHNLITGARQVDLLEVCLKQVAALRDEGRIRIMTQQQLCRELLGRR